MLVALAGLCGWLAGSLLSPSARPATETGYVVQQGDLEESNLGWHAIMVDDPASYDGVDPGNGLSLAGVWWRDVSGSWHQWDGPLSPPPECLAPDEPMEATIAHVKVREGLKGWGGRRAVWMHCHEAASDRG